MQHTSYQTVRVSVVTGCRRVNSLNTFSESLRSTWQPDKISTWLIHYHISIQGIKAKRKIPQFFDLDNPAFQNHTIFPLSLVHVPYLPHVFRFLKAYCSLNFPYLHIRNQEKKFEKKREKMGCSSSKRIEATMDVYRPAPTSFAVFDINAIEEPWLKVEHAAEHHREKATSVPPLILEKLNSLEEAPRSWDEVSRVLEDLKPTLQSPAPAVPDSDKRPPPQPPAQDSPTTTLKPPAIRKSVSFHTVAELDAKLSSKPTDSTTSTELKKTESMRMSSKKPESRDAAAEKKSPAMVASEGMTPVRYNMFIQRDREEREREGRAARFDRMMSRRDPLSEYPDKCPPGGADSLVLYTTSLGGVRRTYEDCNRLRSVMESHRVVFDERDVSLHGEFLNELRELLGEGASVPRLFIKGRYVGGVEEVVELNELGRLGKLLNSAKVERGIGRQGCEGCGGARFVPCLDCGGSCKLVVGETKERCSKCNENGLVQCPVCL